MQNVDKKFCSSSFLMFRTVVDSGKHFTTNSHPQQMKIDFEREGIHSSTELFEVLEKRVEQATHDGKAALALSGGIDSAILARLMPKGSVAYTFKCIVPGVEVVDESKTAALYAKECGLDHRIVEIYWEDFEKYVPLLMKNKGAPIHSIEVQIYKAALQAKRDGFQRVIYGESADCIFGGLSNLLSRDWTVGDFIERYSFVLPYKVLREFEIITEPFTRHEKNGYIDVHEFLSTEFLPESLGSYVNASNTADIEFVAPYSRAFMDMPLDYKRVREGENKYLIREIFNRLYPDFKIPPKTPMPRPTNEWLKNWTGPKRQEFWPHCTDNMSGDQKWLVFCLEWFLNLMENEIA